MTTCTTETDIEWPTGQSDWLTGTATVNITIDTQTVEVSIDSGQTYVAASWVGSPAMSREWQAYVTPADLPAGMTYEVLVKIHDTTGPSPVDVILPAGTITFT